MIVYVSIKAHNVQMPKFKLPAELVDKVDQLMERGIIESRSRFIEQAVEGFLRGSERVSDLVKSLSVGDHAVMFYESVREKREIAFEFLKDGLARGEAVVYVASFQEKLDDVRDAMRRSGIDVEGFERSGRLQILDSAKFYIKGGEFNREVFELLREMIRSAEARGLKGVRGFSDLTVLVRRGLVDDLLSARTHEFLHLLVSARVSEKGSPYIKLVAEASLEGRFRWAM